MLRLLGEDDEAARHGATAGSSRRARSATPGSPRRCSSRSAGWRATRGEWAEAERLHHEALATIGSAATCSSCRRRSRRWRRSRPGSSSHAEAARILGAAERARRELGFVAWPAQRAALAALDGARGATLSARRRSSDALAEGAALDRADAVAWLRRARGARKRPARGWESLTPTEIEVVRHAAAGLTNPQIGERLFITRATVKTHLSHVYAKLGVRNRSELAAKAAGRQFND